MSEIKYPYGKNAEGILVNAKYAIRGEEYICPQCNKSYELRRGEIRRAYFAHKSGHECSYESYLHRVAKEILYNNLKECIANNRQFQIGSFCEYNYKNPLNEEIIRKEYGIHPQFRNIIFGDSEIFLERKYGDYIPDILLINNEIAFFFEIFVFNKCKKEKLEENTVIEINVNNEEDLEKLKIDILIENENVNLFRFPYRESVEKILYEKAFYNMRNIIEKCYEKNKVIHVIERRIKNVKYKGLRLKGGFIDRKEILVGDKQSILKLVINDEKYFLLIVNDDEIIDILCYSNENEIIGFDLEKFMKSMDKEMLLNDFLNNRKLKTEIEELKIEDPKTIVRVNGFQPVGHYSSTIKNIEIGELALEIKNNEFELFKIEGMNSDRINLTVG